MPQFVIFMWERLSTILSKCRFVLQRAWTPLVLIKFVLWFRGWSMDTTKINIKPQLRQTMSTMLNVTLGYKVDVCVCCFSLLFLISFYSKQCSKPWFMSKDHFVCNWVLLWIHVLLCQPICSCFETNMDMSQ